MNDSLLVVCPVLWDQPADRCMESIVAPHSAFGIPPERVLIVDNSRDAFATRYQGHGFRYYRDPDGHNLGVARAWNVGAREILASGATYLVLMSSVMLWGPELHCTFLWQLNEFWGANVIELDGHSWHCIALHRNLFERIGLFDPAFWPAYEESIDWCRRLQLVGLQGGWPHVWTNAMSQGAAMHIKAGLVDSPAAPLLAHYAAKWGGPKGAETYELPWGDKPMDYIEEEPIPVLAQRYGIRNWW